MGYAKHQNFGHGFLLVLYFGRPGRVARLVRTKGYSSGWIFAMVILCLHCHLNGARPGSTG